MTTNLVRIAEFKRSMLIPLVIGGLLGCAMVSYTWANPGLRRREGGLLIGSVIVILCLAGVLIQLARRFTLIRGYSDSLEFYPKWYSVRPTKVVDNLHSLNIVVGTSSGSELDDPRALGKQPTWTSIDLAGDGVSCRFVYPAKNLNPDIAERFKHWSENVVEPSSFTS